ncbi:uncharacterized protein [Miscanthus floridulus]|uniref:uncharacterized protein n=1 Tax=Miscanthus floridulus TaxID=154761 RepID=UPI0034578366
MPYLPEETTVTKKNNRRRKNRARQPQEDTINKINTLQSKYDHLLASPFLAKKDDPGVLTIECTIGKRIFYKTFCDIGSGVNIISKLQMVDQSIRFPEGIAKDVMVRIHDHFSPTNFMVLDMGEEEDNTPIILRRPFFNTTNAIIYVGSGQVHFQFPGEKVHCYFNSYTTYE